MLNNFLGFPIDEMIDNAVNRGDWWNSPDKSKSDLLLDYFLYQLSRVPKVEFV